MQSLSFVSWLLVENLAQNLSVDKQENGKLYSIQVKKRKNINDKDLGN